MKYKELEKYYLCGIGARGDINEFQVGTYDEKRESFSFGNGDLSSNELFKEPRGSNATYVISATCLQEIDDAGLLYMEDTEAAEIPGFEGTTEDLNKIVL